MAGSKNISKSTAEYTRSYENMHGVDFSPVGSEGATQRFGYLENMYIDYEGGGTSVESVPGFRRLYDFGDKINGIFSHKISNGEEYVLVHSGVNLYRFNSESRDNLRSLSPIATLKNSKSHAFVSGRCIYVMDGESLMRISEDGEACAVADGTDAAPYIPTVSRDGVAYESRNLLTNRFRATYFITNPDELTYGTKRLIYEILDVKSKTCAVTGTRVEINGYLNIPSYIEIGGERYAVTQIASGAFKYQTKMTGMVTNPNLLVIGENAFLGCTNLKVAVVCSTVTNISNCAFGDCSSLSKFYLGIGIEKLASTCFDNCEALTIINYAGPSAYLGAVQDNGAFDGRELVCLSPYDSILLGVPIVGDIEKIDSVTINDEEPFFDYDPKYPEVIVEMANRSDACGYMMTIEGSLREENYGEKSGFLSTEMGKILSPANSILASSVSAVLDGIVFLSGNESLGGSVFYCERDGLGNANPLYFPADNFFIDGRDSYTVSSLIVLDDGIAVFKSGDGGDGSIFYHTPKAVGEKTSYPVSYAHRGAVARGETLAFLGEPIFLGTRGVCSLERISGSEARELVTRSGNVNYYLLKENLKTAKITEWRGYLAILTGSHIYLADSRDIFTRGGKNEYEWYYLSGIGSYKNDTRVYRYAFSAPDGYLVSDTPGEKISGVAMSVLGEDGQMIYFVEQDGKSYAIYPTEEYDGGDFSPATHMLSLGELLYFTTEYGSLLVFNNDKRGIAPEAVTNSEDFDAEEYAKIMGNKIHPTFYSFDRHAVSYAARTMSDDCGIPYLTKSTAPHSLVVKYSATSSGGLTFEVRTNKGGNRTLGKFSSSALGFSGYDYSHLPSVDSGFSILRIPERERGWVEKEIGLYSAEFCSPIAVYSLAYRYKIKGKLKGV